MSTVEETVLKTLEREQEDEAFYNSVTNSRLYDELIAKGLVTGARIKQMKESGASVDYSRLIEFDDDGLASVHHAAQHGYCRSVEKLFGLNSEQLELRTQDSAQETPLLIAVKYTQSNDETLKVMVDMGCKLDAVNSRNHGVVELASLNINVEALRFFLALGSPLLPVWKKILNFLGSDFEEYSEKAGMCLKGLTKPSHDGIVSSNWRPIYEEKGIEVLVGVIKSPVGDLAVVQAMHCIINMLSVPEVKEAVTISGGLTALVNHLKSKSWKVVQLSAIILMMMFEIEDNAEQACALGVIPILTGALRTAPEPDALAAAVGALGAIAQGSSKRQTSIQSTPDCISALCALFQECTHQTLLLSLTQAVGKIAASHMNNQNAIVDGGSLSLIVLLCDVKHKSIQMSAVHAVKALVEGNAYTQKLMVREGAVMPLLQIVRKSGSQSVLESAARTVWALAGDQFDNRRVMAEWITIQTLIEFVGSLSETLHFVGSEGLGALAQGARNKQTAIAEANGVHPLLRVLKSDKEHLVLSALNSIRYMCVGVGFAPHQRNQNTLTQARAIKLILTFLTLSNSERIQAQAAVALGAIALNNPDATKDIWQPSQHLEFRYVLILKLLYSRDEEVCILAGDALALFAYNNVAQQQAITKEGGVRFQCFGSFLHSANELHRCAAAFQTVVLSRIIPDEDQAISSAAGIKVLIDLLNESDSGTVVLALAADCVARLAHTRAGIPDAFIAVEAVDKLCELMLEPTEHIRGCAAIALAYLSHNHKAERQLLNRCRLDPYLAKCLFYYTEKSQISPRFLEEWKHYKKVGLPPTPDGRPSLMNSHLPNPYPTAASRRLTAPESTEESGKLVTSLLTPRSRIEEAAMDKEFPMTPRMNSIKNYSEHTSISNEKNTLSV